MKPKDIKLKVTYTEGYQQRFTEACLKQLRLRDERKKIESQKVGDLGKTA